MKYLFLLIVIAGGVVYMYMSNDTIREEVDSVTKGKFEETADKAREIAQQKIEEATNSAEKLYDDTKESMK